MRRGPQWLGMLVLLCACQEPTQITIEVTTDVDCSALLTGIAVGAYGEVEGKPASATRAQCDTTGRVGSLVAVPAGEGSREVAFHVVSHVGGELSLCDNPTAGDDCIVSRRVLSYLDNKKLLVPVVQRDICRGVPCDEDTTCVRGDCVPARIDPNACADADGCGEEELVGSGGGGGVGGSGGSSAGGSGGAGGAGGGSLSLDPLWALSFGDASGADRGVATAVGPSGDVFVGASMALQGSYVFGGGQPANDLAIVRFDHNTGAVVTPYTNLSGSTELTATVVDGNNNVYFAGGALAPGNYGNNGNVMPVSTRSPLLGRVTSDGSLAWAKAFGGQSGLASHLLYDLAKGQGSDHLAVGTTDALSVMFDNNSVGAHRLVLFGFAPNGTVSWLQSWPGYVTNVAMDVDAAGNIYLAGSYNGTIDFGVPQPSQRSDIFLAKCGPDGSLIQAKLISTQADESAADIAVDASGNIYVTGTAEGPIDFDTGLRTPLGGADVFVAAFNTSLTGRWSQMIGSTVDDSVSSIVLNTDGNLFISGQRNTAGFIASWTPGGVPRIVQTYPDVGNGSPLFAQLAATSQGGIAATGGFSGIVNFGGTSMDLTSSPQDENGFLVKLIER